jgi:hypothetical protein
LTDDRFSTKEAQPEEDPSVSARLQRLQNNYEDFGMRRTVEGVLVVHDHGHPHILMLQIANAFFKLPGDYLKPGEDEVDGLKRRLDERLAPPSDSRQFNASHGVDNDWEIGDCLAQWWRPNFETFMVRIIKALCTLCRNVIELTYYARCTPPCTICIGSRICSILSFLHISLSQRNARSSFLCKCRSAVCFHDLIALA